jgi:hypothetical protein
VAPTAGTRLTEDLVPQEIYDMMTAESVTAGALLDPTEKDYAYYL